jgi:hypothetical protein
MLSDHEQRELTLIEAGLAADDRRFARAFGRRSVAGRRRWPARAATCLGSLMVVIGLLSGAVPSLILEGLLIGGAGVVWSWWLASRAPARPSDGNSVQPAKRPPESSGPV